MSPRRVVAIMRHEMQLVIRDPLPVMILLIFPLILMAFLKPAFGLALVAAGYPQANGAEQVVPGQAVANGFYIVGMTSFAFFAEYGWCTWDRLRASQATTVEIIVGKAAPRLTMSVAQFVAVFAIGIPLLDLRVRGPLWALLPLVVAFGTCLVLLGVMITALCHTLQQASAVAFGGLVLFGAIGGALVPTSVLPAMGPRRRARNPDLLGHARLQQRHPRRPWTRRRPATGRRSTRHGRRLPRDLRRTLPSRRHQDQLRVIPDAGTATRCRHATNTEGFETSEFFVERPDSGSAGRTLKRCRFHDGVEVSGLEPPASSLRTTRSSQLSYTPEGPSSPKEGSA